MILQDFSHLDNKMGADYGAYPNRYAWGDYVRPIEWTGNSHRTKKPPALAVGYVTVFSILALALFIRISIVLNSIRRPSCYSYNKALPFIVPLFLLNSPRF